MGGTRWLLMGAVLLAAPAALACGGLFCSSGPGAAPVDQRAERILFEVYGERICTTVQILYEGTPTQFAWVVPVPSTPEVSDGSNALFTRLEAASQPRFLLPPASCDSYGANFTGYGRDDGCGCDGGEDEYSGDDFLTPEEQAARLPVEVFGRQSTESYDTVTLAAESAADVVLWLQLNQYQVSDNMIPAMQPYADAGDRFLAVQLRAGAGGDSIQPLRFCYDAGLPKVPLRLTAVAARPQMAVQVFVASDMLFESMDPPATRPDPEGLVFDVYNRVNYHAWVARRVAGAEGRFMVDEWSGKNPSPTGEIDGCEQCGFERELPMLSRFYTRLDPEHMTWDPVFVPSEAPPNEGVVDMRGHASVSHCTPYEEWPSPCEFMWCGAAGDCVEDLPNERGGCVCGEDTVAAALTDLEGIRQITCVPADNPLAVQAPACGGVDCGRGACVSRGGFPACDCEAGAMAVIEGGRPRCVGAEAMQPWDPWAEAEARKRRAARDRIKRAADARAPRLGFGLLALLAALVATGHRRRR